MSTKKKTEVTISEPKIAPDSHTLIPEHDRTICPICRFEDEQAKAAAFGVNLVHVDVVVQDEPVPVEPQCFCEKCVPEEATRTPYTILRDRAIVIYNELRASEMKARTMPVGKYRPNIAEMARESADMIDELMRYIRNH
jgi:hypothetical protein